MRYDSVNRIRNIYDFFYFFIFLPPLWLFFLNFSPLCPWNVKCKSIRAAPCLTRAIICSSAKEANSPYNWELKSPALVIHCLQRFEVPLKLNNDSDQLVTVSNVLALTPVLFWKSSVIFPSCPVKVSHRSDWLPGPDVFHLRLIVSPGCVFLSPCYSDDCFLLTLCLVCVILLCFDHWVMPADSASLLWYRTFCCMENLELWILECAFVSLHDCAW